MRARRGGEGALVGTSLILAALASGVASRANEPPHLDINGRPLPAGAVARLGSPRINVGWSPRGLAFTPDGAALVTAGEGETFTIATLPAGDHAGGPAAGVAGAGERQAGSLRTFRVAESEHCRVLGIRGKDLSLACRDRLLSSVRRVDLSGAELDRKSLPDETFAVALSADGRLLACIDDRRRVVELRRAKTLELEKGISVDLSAAPPTAPAAAGAAGSPQREASPVRGLGGVGFSPGETFVTAALGNAWFVWDVATGALVRAGRASGRVEGLALSPNEKLLALADGSLHVVDLATGNEVMSHTVKYRELRTVAFSTDGQLVIAAGKAVVAARTADWSIVLERARYETDTIASVAFAPNRHLAAAAPIGSSGAIELWDADALKEVRLRPGHVGRLFSVTFFPDSRRVATAGEDARIRIWEARTGRLLHELAGPETLTTKLLISPSGTHVICGSFKEASLYRLHDGTCLWDSGKDTLTPNSFAFGGSDTTIQLLDLNGDRHVFEAAAPPTLPTPRLQQFGWSAHSPDLKRTVLIRSGSRDQLIVRDEGAGDERLIQLRDPSTTSQFHAGIASNGTIYTWNEVVSMSMGGEEGSRGLVFRCRLRVFGPSGDETCRVDHTGWSSRDATLSPDGSTLAVPGFDEVLLWHLESNDLTRLPTSSHELYDVDYSPDGSLLAASGDDGTALVWEMGTR